MVGRHDYLDLALGYALINFIGVLAVLEFFHQRKVSETNLAMRDEGDSTLKVTLEGEPEESPP